MSRLAQEDNDFISNCLKKDSMNEMPHSWIPEDFFFPYTRTSIAWLCPRTPVNPVLQVEVDLGIPKQDFNPSSCR